MSETLRLKENTLAIPKNMELKRGEKMSHGTLTVNLACEWPIGVSRDCSRTWIIKDNPTDINVITEYRTPAGILIKNNSEVLLRPVEASFFVNNLGA